MTRTLFIVALAFGSGVVPFACSDAAVLYAANGAQGNPSTLVVLNQTTGAVASTVGPIGFAVTGLAVHPVTGVLYGSVSRAAPVSPGSLITIDKTTGAGTLTGFPTAGSPRWPSVPAGRCWGWESRPSLARRPSCSGSIAQRAT